MRRSRAIPVVRRAPNARATSEDLTVDHLTLELLETASFQGQNKGLETSWTVDFASKR